MHAVLCTEIKLNSVLHSPVHGNLCFAIMQQIKVRKLWTPIYNAVVIKFNTIISLLEWHSCFCLNKGIEGPQLMKTDNSL